jgi:Ca2+-binding RTX toxin-like protein
LVESPGVIADGGYGEDSLRAFYNEVSAATGSTLRGAAGHDELDTYVSDTELWGGRGNDRLIAQVTHDVLLVGGAGDDYVESNYGIDSAAKTNRVLCGPGKDTARVSVNDDVAADCEVVLYFPD